MPTVTINQRIYGLAMAGHPADNIAESLDIPLAQVKTLLKDLTSPQVTTQAQRVHDLSAAGHSVEQIGYFLDLTEDAVSVFLQDLTVGPSATGGAYTGSP